jgi:antitoxin (DNA-binding transcriptional repressor) of toxin-antitoxin stability system
MATIQISEADAVRDFAAVLAHVRTGSEVVIEGESAPVAVLIPPTDVAADHDPEYDAWFRSQVQEALDDPRPGIPNEEVEAEFAQRRAATLRTIKSSAE